MGAFYWITPIPPSWPRERIESKLREYNFYGLKILTIHEAMPGHYVQFEYANDVQPQLRRVLRAVFGNGPYVEGWAVYATDFMLEAGYLNNSPELRLTFLKHQLRVLANTILDVRLHTKGMTDQEALDLMINDGFQEREEAIGKLQRAKLSSAQLPTYYVGWRDWKRLRDRVRSEKGAALLSKGFHESSLREGAVPLAGSLAFTYRQAALVFQEAQHLSQRCSAMTDSLLSFAGYFAEGAAERRIVKQRIVTKPICPARLRQQFAFHRPTKRLNQLSVPNQRDNADISRRPVR